MARLSPKLGRNRVDLIRSAQTWMYNERNALQHEFNRLNRLLALVRDELMVLPPAPTSHPLNATRMGHTSALPDNVSIRGLRARCNQWEDTEVRVLFLQDIVYAIQIRRPFILWRSAVRITPAAAVERCVTHPNNRALLQAGLHAFVQIRLRAGAAALVSARARERAEYRVDHYMVSAFIRWRHETQRRQHDREALADGANAARLLRGCLLAWWQTIPDIVAEDTALASSHYSTALARHTLDRWMEEVVAHRMMLVHDLKVRRRVWVIMRTEWETRVKANRKAEAMARTGIRRMLAHVVTEWAGITRRNRPDRQRTAIVQTRAELLSVITAWEQWRTVLARRQLLRRVVGVAAQCWRYRVRVYSLEQEEVDLARSALQAWFEIAQRSARHHALLAEQAKADLFNRGLLVSRHWQAWREYGDERACGKRMARTFLESWCVMRRDIDSRGDLIQSRRELVVLDSCFRQWYVRQHDNTLVRRHCQWRALHCWQAVVKADCHQRPAAHHAIHSTRVHFAHWVKLLRQKKLLADRLVIFRRRQVSRVKLVVLHAMAGRLRSLNHRGRLLSSLHATFTRRRVFNHWAQSFDAAHRARLQDFHAAELADFHCQARVFHRWCRFIADERRARRFEYAADSLLARRLHLAAADPRRAAKLARPGLHLSMLLGGARLASVRLSEGGSWLLPTGVPVDPWSLRVHDYKCLVTAFQTWRAWASRRAGARVRRRERAIRGSAISMATPVAVLAGR
ncbi:hypothetical protein J8273_8909 [Carpediemonas membranifera]|uniref:Sfi1 spindle body domain-containing protein n=1 Tax=Carpediemonas membranifera TaxID=201153 RepID=A0A8J6BTR4_9EUKA|nr:hypothetical protein J8273_8909 [Carpediemonas membranifera]|eukprot:KAG9389616.1 hypothetical protein J8273_8909 [Carpediemonas membranifera]